MKRSVISYWCGSAPLAKLKTGTEETKKTLLYCPGEISRLISKLRSRSHFCCRRGSGKICEAGYSSCKTWEHKINRSKQTCCVRVKCRENDCDQTKSPGLIKRGKRPGEQWMKSTMMSIRAGHTPESEREVTTPNSGEPEQPARGGDHTPLIKISKKYYKKSLNVIFHFVFHYNDTFFSSLEL